jgi:hypothetical protein
MRLWSWIEPYVQRVVLGMVTARTESDYDTPTNYFALHLRGNDSNPLLS